VLVKGFAPSLPECPPIPRCWNAAAEDDGRCGLAGAPALSQGLPRLRLSGRSILLVARTGGVRTTRGHLRRETRRVSIRAIPKNSLFCQGKPDNDPCRDHEGAMGSVSKDDVEQGEGSCSQRRGHLIQVRAILSRTLGDLDAVIEGDEASLTSLMALMTMSPGSSAVLLPLAYAHYLPPAAPLRSLYNLDPRRCLPSCPAWGVSPV
jgi:hypothetical protein